MPDARDEAAPAVTVVLPTRNESGYIAEMLRRTVASCERGTGGFEIIVVDNASEDGTPDLVAGIAEADPRIRVIVHPENLLYARSCLTGVRASRGSRTFIIDSDGQHDPDDIWKFDAKLDEGYDLVFGWRTERSEPPQRILMSRVLLWLTRLHVGFPFHDINCGIRGMSRRYCDALEIRHRVNFVNPELYVRGRLAGMRMTEIKVRQESRKAGVSSHEFGRLWRIFTTVERYLLALRRELRHRP